MEVTQLPFTGFPEEKPRPRSTVTYIIRDLLRIMDPKRYATPVTDETRAAFERGFAFEDLLKITRLWPARTMLQVEFELDGILGHLDGFNMEEECVYESKCTLLSSNNPILGEKFLSWRWQIMAYCKMAGVSTARLDILHLCGDWNPPRTIPPVLWLWKFQQNELDLNFSMLRRQRDRMVKQGRL